MDYLPKDPAILVSSVNMLLRDEEFDTLESLCYNFGTEPKEIKDTFTGTDLCIVRSKSSSVRLVMKK